MRFVTKVCECSPCFKEVENLPRFGLVSPLKAQERRVRVVPIIGGESDDKECHRSRYLSHSCVDLFGGSGYKELYRSGVYPIVVFICFRSKG